MNKVSVLKHRERREEQMLGLCHSHSQSPRDLYKVRPGEPRGVTTHAPCTGHGGMRCSPPLNSMAHVFNCMHRGGLVALYKTKI